jgi:hypothetical protein
VLTWTVLTRLLTLTSMAMSSSTGMKTKAWAEAKTMVLLLLLKPPLLLLLLLPRPVLTLTSMAMSSRTGMKTKAKALAEAKTMVLLLLLKPPLRLLLLPLTWAKAKAKAWRRWSLTRLETE